MTKKRILLVGDGNHQFITNYTVWLNKQSNIKFQIDILSLSLVNNSNADYYNKIYSINDNSSISSTINQIKGVRRYYRFLQYKKLLQKLPEYDFIHFHFISVDCYFLVDQLKKHTKSKIILSIWGSDMYKVKPVNEKGFIQSCHRADYITFTNQKSIEYFASKYNWVKNNLKLCRFGLAPLENLKELKASKSECKNILNWNKDKLAITIGYNLASAQQHLKILDLFETDEIKAFKNQIQLIFPITYGGNEKYKNQILEKLNHLPYECKVYDTFLEDKTITYIRKASDIMIQLQETDQFSGSMQEHLFARNIVITGSWLPYETMKEKGVWFIEINKIAELVEVLPKIINHYTEYELKTVDSPNAITKLSSWEKNIKSWIDLYKY
ncbi:MAG TPA: glycosyltransferase [Prolixibacteraceae bacterium]|nr:glycosyltransferase [Prolixibacteraceae bacterium]